MKLSTWFKIGLFLGIAVTWFLIIANPQALSGIVQGICSDTMVKILVVGIFIVALVISIIFADTITAILVVVLIVSWVFLIFFPSAIDLFARPISSF